MKKAVFQSYGGLDTIQIIESTIPTPASGEVLVKVDAAGLNPKDILFRKGKFKSLSGKKFPQTIGYDFAGTIEDPIDSTYQKGDRVYGMINGFKGRCCAEYLNASTKEIARMPDNITPIEAAGIPLAGQTALQAIRDLGSLQTGQSICINGASGGVGTLAIQMAKILGARVTTVSSSKNIDFCKSLGADQAIAYDQTKLTEITDRFDLFYDVFGNYNYQKVSSLLKPRGIYVTTVPKPDIFKEQILNLFRGKKAKMVVVKSKTSDLQWMADQMAKGTLKPIVDQVFPLAAIREAQKHIESKRAKGKVIIDLKA